MDMTTSGRSSGGGGGSSSNGKELEKPGKGWSNGEMAKSMMYVHTREGRVRLYHSERRWITLAKSWARHTGEATDTKHTSSAKGESLVESKEEEGRTIRALMSQLCESFYKQGHMPGTGGGMSMRSADGLRAYCTPSGIQKEDMIGDDIFEMNMNEEVICPPVTPGLKLSSMTNLWFLIYQHYPEARCVIHTHSMNAQLVTLTTDKKYLTLTHFEMLKGVGNHAYNDTLYIPIIDNQPSEDLLAPDIQRAMHNYPKCNAVLVRRHGIYVWGDSWEQAKTQYESFDYLFQTAIQLHQMGLDPSTYPSTKLNNNKNNKNNNENIQSITPQKSLLPTTTTTKDTTLSTSTIDILDSDNNNSDDDFPYHPTNKRRRTNDSPPNDTIVSSNKTKSVGFGGASSTVATTTTTSPTSHTSDTMHQDEMKLRPLPKSKVPMLPKLAKILLLDIEGVTTLSSFVKDLLSSFVSDNLNDFLESDASDCPALSQSLQRDVKDLPVGHPAKTFIVDEITRNVTIEETKIIHIYVHGLMKFNVSSPGLKQLQSLMWDAGFRSGDLKGHIFPDFPHMLKWMNDYNVKICIYSSNPIAIQKLLFSHSTHGDLCPIFHRHYDVTTSGHKLEPLSYVNIARDLNVHPSQICYVSSNERELVAARMAGIVHSAKSVRLGHSHKDNKTSSSSRGGDFPIISSLMQLCGCE